jgi:hypothetical protein
VLAFVIFPILIAAFVMLYLLPQHTDQLFAWGIKPTMSAMMLGATYLGGAYFFIRVLIARKWHTITLGLLPVAAFASYLGIATLLHWARFNQGHISFVLWAILYFTLPFILPLAWLRNREQDPGRRISDVRLPRLLRVILGLEGGGLVIVSLLLLIVPEQMIPTWPWTLTALTARVMAAMFVLPGLVGLGIARDGRWSAARVIVQAQTGAILLILVAVVFAEADFDWSRAVSWIFVLGLAVLAIGLVGVYVAMEKRQINLVRITHDLGSA